MDPSTTQAQIQELESVRKQINLWRSGAVAIVFVTTIICVGVLYSDVKALALQGPAQERFISQFQAGLNENVVPRLREEAGRTVTEMQPVVQAEFLKLNDRVPELTQASLKQIDELQKSLPERSAKALDETFTAALNEQEPEIRKMFPDATEEQVKGLFTNLGNVVAARGESMADELLSPHLAAMTAIHENLKKIQASDKASAAKAGDDWQLGLAVFDVLRDDVKDLTISDKKAAKLLADAAGKIADTAGHVKNEANKMAKEGN